MTDRAKRHWRYSTQAAVAVVAAGLVTLSVLSGWQSQLNAQVATPGSVAPGNTTEVEELVDAVTYSRVQAVRRSAGMEAQDLAALDLTGEQAEAVLRQLLAWTEQNTVRLEAADRSVMQAERELRETQRQISMGPRDERVLRSFAAQSEAVTTTRQQQLALHQEAARQALSTVRSDQRAIWETVHARRDASGRVKTLSTADRELLRDYTLAQRPAGNARNQSGLQTSGASGGRASGVLSSGESGGESLRVESLRQTRQPRLPGVLTAETKVLPVPASLVESYPIDPTPERDAP